MCELEPHSEQLMVGRILAIMSRVEGCDLSRSLVMTSVIWRVGSFFLDLSFKKFLISLLLPSNGSSENVPSPRSSLKEMSSALCERAVWSV